MLMVLFDWVYILLVVALFGMLTNRLLKIESNSLVKISMTGVVVTTVLVEYISIFYKIGMLVHLLVLAICAVTAWLERKRCKEILSGCIKEVLTWQGLVYVGIILVVAFYSSRGIMHSDTSMYHAQAIRWYEEYGLTVGQVNLQTHFGYNSACFAFAALFSMGFLGGQPLHCTTGFIAVLLCIWAVKRLAGFFSHERHMFDMCCVAILFYALVNACGFMSPASDYMTMFIAIYLIARWAEEIESGSNNVQAFAMLSVLAVYLTSLKLSAGLCVLLVIYPMIFLIKEKKWRDIGKYLILGLMVILPFLVRNVIISGWLLYPFSAIDLFNVDWKLPVSEVERDSAFIKIWARGVCIGDKTLVNMPMSQWVPIWWEYQERYAQMLVLTNFLAAFLSITIIVHKLVKKIKIDWNFVLLFGVIVINAIAWFVLAPFIRYGLAFLLTLPLLAIGTWFKKEESSLYKVVSGATVTLMVLIVLPYIDHYFTDDMVFLKQRLRDNYYVVQKDYEAGEMYELNIDGLTVYCPVHGEATGYYAFPSSAYSDMPQNMELRGSNIKDGFKPKPGAYED